MVEGSVGKLNFEKQLSSSNRPVSNLNFLDLMKGEEKPAAVDNSKQNIPGFEEGRPKPSVSSEILRAAQVELGKEFEKKPGIFDDVLSQVLNRAGCEVPVADNSDKLEETLLQNGFSQAGSDLKCAQPGDVVLTFNAHGRGTDASVVGSNGESYGLEPQRDGKDKWVEFPNIFDSGKIVILSPPK
jgi:hypothetical protein